MNLVLNVNPELRPTTKTIWELEWLDKKSAKENGNTVYLNEVRDLITFKRDEADDEVELTQEQQNLFADF